MNTASQEHPETETPANKAPANESAGKASAASASRPAAEISTDDPMFDDIRHYRDDEVPEVVKRVVNDSSLLSGIARNMFPSLPKFMHAALKPVIRYVIRKKFSKVATIRDCQEYVAQFMEGVIKNSTDGFTYEGFDKLDPKKGYLFISNHRDISLDPAFIDMCCHYNNLDTVKIAIGDNLLRMPVATDLMKLNKSFIVKRSLTSVKDKIKAFSELSAYIGAAIRENHNVWIAQREGRAKDGNDATEDAILKMFYMFGKKLGMSFPEYIKTLNIVPVSISYEFDPGDVMKARELYEKSQTGNYTKSEFEDIDSIVGGIKGYKGRVHVSAGEPLTGEYADASALSRAIDTFIYSHYKLFPSVLVAAGHDEKVSPEEKSKFMERINCAPEELRPYMMKMYGAPYFNHEKCVLAENGGDGAKAE